MAILVTRDWSWWGPEALRVSSHVESKTVGLFSLFQRRLSDFLEECRAHALEDVQSSSWGWAVEQNIKHQETTPPDCSTLCNVASGLWGCLHTVLYIQYPGRPPVYRTLLLTERYYHHHQGSAAEQNRIEQDIEYQRDRNATCLFSPPHRSNTSHRPAAKVLNWPSCCDRAEWSYCSIQASGGVIYFVCLRLTW